MGTMGRGVAILLCALAWAGCTQASETPVATSDSSVDASSDGSLDASSDVPDDAPAVDVTGADGPSCFAPRVAGSRQLQAVIAAAPGPVDLPVSEVVVTFVKPASSGEAGFFVQAERGGPAVFVLASALAPGAIATVGDRVSFRVTSKRFESSAPQIGTLDGWVTLASGVDVEALRQDVSNARNLVSSVITHESTLVSAVVTVDGPWVNAARGHLRANVTAAGTDAAATPRLVVRLPSSAFDPMSYPTGCTFRINGVVWRFGDQPQLSAYRPEDIGPCITATPTPAEPPLSCDDRLLPIPRLGSEATLDLGTWNLRGFPSAPDTPARAAAAIRALDLDLMGLQELAFRDTFDQLLTGLPGYSGILSHPGDPSQSFQLVRGIVFRTSVLTLIEQITLLPAHPDFVNGVLMARFRYQRAGVPQQIAVVVLHLKAGTTDADYAWRGRQVVSVEAAIRARVDGGDTMLVVMGDFNEDPSESRGAEILAPLLGSPERYTLHTAPLVAFDTTHSGGRFIDHILTTRPLADVVGARAPVVVHLERAIPGYARFLSDHLPVTLSVPLP